MRRGASRVLNASALLTGGPALLATVWIVLPAPSYNFWLLAVAAGEWGLWFAALGALAVLCGLLARAGGGGRLWVLSSTAGGLAVLLGCYPLASGLGAARAHGAALSLRQYVADSDGAADDSTADSSGAEPATYTFAAVAGRPLRLDAYLPPPGVESREAGVIVVHGGSWSAGARSDFPRWNLWLAREGYAVFDVDYRLAPQPNWLAAGGDVKCAVAWVKRHAGEFGVSPDRLALMGRSAGGHLALLAAYSADDGRLPPSCPAGEGAAESSQAAGVRAVISFYAPTDLLWAYDHPANRRVIDGPDTLRRFLGGDPHKSDEMRERFRLASPTAHVTSRTPPTLLVHGGRDQLVRSENMRLLGAKLDGAGVTRREIFLPYAQHGFDYNFGGWGAQIVRPVLLGFLRETTGPR